MKEYKVLGWTYAEAEEITKELNIEFDFDMGTVGLEGCDDTMWYEDVETLLLDHLEKKYQISIPRTNMRIFCSDGDQYFSDIGFDWGIIFQV